MQSSSNLTRKGCEHQSRLNSMLIHAMMGHSTQTSIFPTAGVLLIQIRDHRICSRVGLSLSGREQLTIPHAPSPSSRSALRTYGLVQSLVTLDTLNEDTFHKLCKMKLPCSLFCSKALRGCQNEQAGANPVSSRQTYSMVHVQYQ